MSKFKIRLNKIELFFSPYYKTSDFLKILMSRHAVGISEREIKKALSSKLVQLMSPIFLVGILKTVASIQLILYMKWNWISGNGSFKITGNYRTRIQVFYV